MDSSPISMAVILAAGSGTKFWPYNVVRQKCAFPIANVPTVRRLAEALHTLGMERIVVVVGQGERSIRAAMHGFTGSVQFVRQPQPDGTADAALHALADLDEDALVVHGDLVTAAANLAAVKQRFEQERPLAAVLVQLLGDQSPRDNIVAHVESDQLSGVEGHSRGGQYRLAGVYGLRSDAIPYLQDNPGYVQSVPVGGMPPVEADIAQSLQLMIDDGAPVAAVHTEDYHVDLDKPWQILEANNAYMAALRAETTENVIPASARIHDGAEIDGKIVMGDGCFVGNRVVVQGDLWMEPGARIENGAILKGAAIIGADTLVRDYALIGPYSALGPRGLYGHGSEFTGVALDKVHCYHYCEIEGVVGYAVDFGAATVCGNLRFDDGQTTWRINGRYEQPSHGANYAYFGDYCRTGVNAIIMPGRRIGVYSCVGAGVVLYDDVPDRQLVAVKQELTQREWGPQKYGW